MIWFDEVGIVHYNSQACCIFFRMKYSFDSELASGADVLIVPMVADKKDKEVGDVLSPSLQELATAAERVKDFEGKSAQLCWLYTKDVELPRVLLVGLGSTKDLTMRRFKHALGAAVIASQGKKAERLALYLPSFVAEVFSAKMSGRATAIAIETASYSYDTHKSDVEARVKPVKEVQVIHTLRSGDKQQLEKGFEEGAIIGDSISWARDLGNTPPTAMTPTLLANEAKKVAKLSPNLSAKILSKSEIEKLKMGCLLGVSRGSEEEPKFIIVEYWGAGKKHKPTVLVGKGITFDSGGISLKPWEMLIDMKFDMLGGATALGIVRSLALLGIKKNVVVLIPACENMPGGTAYRPDDILVAMNGKTVEIGNTDAEGRLVLADGLCYAKRYEPKEVIDLATLTGACMVALGNERSGVFTNEEVMAEKLLTSAETTGEQLWRLPLGEEFSEAIKSDVADIKNIGGVGRPMYGGASTGAAFLQFFADGFNWAHIDLSCSHYGGKGKPWIRGGANGWGVETMVEYLRGSV